jgi:hypothetical protein
MATTITQAPAAPPTPTISTTRSPPSSASASAATIQSGLTRRQTSLASSGASISPPAATSAQQRPNLALQTTTRPSTPASTPSQAHGTSSQPSSAGSQTHFYSPTSAISPCQAPATGSPAQAQAHSSPASAPLQPQLPSANPQTTANPLASTFTSTPAQSPQVQHHYPLTSGSPIPSSPISTSTRYQQAASTPQTPTTPKAPDALQIILNKLHSLGEWTNIGLALAALIVAVYFGATMLSYAGWTKNNDFCEGCINDQEHRLPLSAECSEELLRTRVSVVKRQIEEVSRGFVCKSQFVRFGVLRDPIGAGLDVLLWCVISFVIGYMDRLAFELVTNPTLRSEFFSNPLYYPASFLLIALVSEGYDLFLAVYFLFKFAGTCCIVAGLWVSDVWNRLGGNRRR